MEEVVLTEAECREVFQGREEDTEPEAVLHYVDEESGSLPQDLIHESITAPVALNCPGCDRPPGAVVARGAKSEFQMGVRWTVNQLKIFLEAHMSGVQAGAVAEKFSQIVVVED